VQCILHTNEHHPFVLLSGNPFKKRIKSIVEIFGAHYACNLSGCIMAEDFMDDGLKDMIDELQATILKEAEETYSPVVIERWRNPRNWGVIEEADGFSKITGPCGDTMQITLKVDDNRITEVRYMTDGCATSIAAGSAATELAQARSLEEVRDINQEMILEALGGLPEESRHCALLASNALRAATRDYLQSRETKT
jgi:nitrogen fixation protein NifU and related proteins